jgi:hypothetical protein
VEDAFCTDADFMKNLLVVVLSLSVLSCTAVHRHPTITKVALISAGAVGGLALGLATRQQNCPSLGGRYNGTPGINGCPTWCDRDGCYTGHPPKR